MSIPTLCHRDSDAFIKTYLFIAGNDKKLYFDLQIESSSALGAINTPDFEKKFLAAQSLEYNLRDKLFCELFPDTVAVSIYSFSNTPCQCHDSLTNCC